MSIEHASRPSDVQPMVNGSFDRTKILVVDDETSVRENLAEVLVQEGFEVLAAPTGKAALEVLERKIGRAHV